MVGWHSQKARPYWLVAWHVLERSIHEDFEGLQFHMFR